MTKNIRIAHISDLHCNNSPRWQENFHNVVIPCIKSEIRPHLIVITGDSVHHPYGWNYKMLARNIKYMYDELKTASKDLHIITIPGNHDYSIFGNRWGYLNLRRGLYRRFLKDLVIPGPDAESTADSFFKKYRIALFPLDSNARGSAFAAGRVDEPHEVLIRRDEHFEEIALNLRFDYRKCTKIVLLHHHPLPVATAESAEQFEGFMMLNNSYQFLEASCSIGATLVLHGHKHVSGTSEFTLFDDAQSSKSIIVSSCASTGYYDDSNEREIKYISLTENGTCSILSYRRSNNTHFYKADHETLALITYERIRNRNCLFTDAKEISESPIEAVKQKYKEVIIDNDGNAEVRIKINEISWKAGLEHNEKEITENLRADTGRINAGEYEFGECPLEMIIDPEDWSHPYLNTENYPTPSESDSFPLVCKTKRFYGKQDCCKIQYSLLNGFSLTKQQHNDSYGDWPSERRREEISCIESLYPTETLKLRVQFPDSIGIPESHYVEAVQRERAIILEEGCEMLHGKYFVNSEESNYLVSSAAVKVIDEDNAIELTVEQPQPDLIYVLRWVVPEKDGVIDLPPVQERILRKLRDEVLNKESVMTQNFYDEIVSLLEKPQVFGGGLKVFLLGYDDDEKAKLLEVVRYPDENPPKSKLFVGRGPAGKAFKTGRVVYWEKMVRCARVREEQQMQQLENVVENLDPIIVVALPLSYPLLDGPAFGVISIVATEEGSSLQRFINLDDEGKSKVISELNKQISQLLDRNFEFLENARSVGV